MSDSKQRDIDDEIVEEPESDGWESNDLGDWEDLDEEVEKLRRH